MIDGIDWQSLPGDWLEQERQERLAAKAEAIRAKHRAAQRNKQRLREYDAYEEEEHPRGEHGRWSSKGGGAENRWTSRSGLEAEARKAGSFENFRHDFHLDIKHGIYWHFTNDPNFHIDPEKGPRDLSSMAVSGDLDKGKLMITSDLDAWADYGPEGKGRKYVAQIDMREVPRSAYRQVNRGFGNEFFVHDPSQARVVRVVSQQQAYRIDQQHDKTLPQSETELRQFYNRATQKSEAELDRPHWQELHQTGYWGKQGAGAIIMARDTGRFLLPHRSMNVEQSGTWGTWGGAIDEDEAPHDAAQREMKEETGYHGHIEKVVPLSVFEDKKVGFKYHNFLVVVPHEFEPVHNWETQGHRWVEFGQWPQPLHFGLARVLKNEGDLKIIHRHRLGDAFEEGAHPRGHGGKWTEKGSTEQTGPQARFAKLRERYQARVQHYRYRQQMQRFEQNLERELTAQETPPTPVEYSTEPYINTHFEQDDPGRAADLHDTINDYFPEHADDNHVKILNDEDQSYNCFAWALGITDRWVNADEAEEKVEAVGKELGTYEASSYAPKPGFVNIAEYNEIGTHDPTHMARQLSNGRWTSKCGASALIEHDLQDLEGDYSYGQVERVFQVPLEQWEKIAND